MDCHFQSDLSVWPWASCPSTWGPKPAHLLPGRGGALRVLRLIFWCAGSALPLGNGILTGTLFQRLESRMKLSLSLASLLVSSIPWRDTEWDFIRKPSQATVVLGHVYCSLYTHSQRPASPRGQGKGRKSAHFTGRCKAFICMTLCVHTCYLS